MQHQYQFTISGMTCHSCESLITMDLEEAGFKPDKIDHMTGLMTIKLDEDQVEPVKTVIAATKHYQVTAVQQL